MKPYLDRIKKQIERKKLTFEIFKKVLFDYKSNFISYHQLKYFKIYHVFFHLFYRDVFIKELDIKDDNYLNELISCLGEESNDSLDSDGWVSLSRLKFELGFR